MTLNSFFRWNSRLLPPLGLLLNFTLLWLILRRTPKEMWTHNRVLLQHSLLGILLYLFSLIAIPVFSYFSNDIFYNIISSYKKLLAH
jgi:hypothetical protein